MLGLVALGGYVGSIVVANMLVTRFGVVPIGFGLMAPAGVFVAGLAFTLRDVVQRLLGRKAVAAAILVGAGVAFVVTDAHRLAIASAVAFLLSELLDFAIFTPLIERGRWATAVLASNTVGVVVDSVVFLAIAFGSLDLLAGQIVGKEAVTLATVAVLAPLRRQLLRVA